VQQEAEESLLALCSTLQALFTSSSDSAGQNCSSTQSCNGTTLQINSGLVDLNSDPIWIEATSKFVSSYQLSALAGSDAALAMCAETAALADEIEGECESVTTIAVSGCNSSESRYTNITIEHTAATLQDLPAILGLVELDGLAPLLDDGNVTVDESFGISMSLDLSSTSLLSEDVVDLAESLNLDDTSFDFIRAQAAQLSTTTTFTTTAAQTQTEPPVSTPDGLASSEVAGIAVGGVVLVVAIFLIVYFTACTRRKKVKMQRSKTIRTHQPALSDRRGTLGNPGFGDLVIAPSRPGRRRVTNSRHTATVSPSEMELNEAVDAAVLVHHDTKISADSVPLHDPSLEPVGKVRIQVARQPRAPRALDVRREDTGAQSNGTQKQGERDTGLGPRQPTAALARQGTHLELSDHVDVEEDKTEHL